MTSRRIDSHKNYMDVLNEHKRATKAKRLLKMAILIAFSLGMMLFLYYVVSKTVQIDEKLDKTSQVTQVIKKANTDSSIQNIN